MNTLFSDFSCSPAKLQSSSSISRNCCYLKKAHRKFIIQLFEYLDTNKLSKISSVLDKPNLEEKPSNVSIMWEQQATLREANSTACLSNAGMPSSRVANIC